MSGCRFCQHYRMSLVDHPKYGKTEVAQCAIGHTKSMKEWASGEKDMECYVPHPVDVTFTRLENNINLLLLYLKNDELKTITTTV